LATALGSSLGLPFCAAFIASLCVDKVATKYHGLQWGYFLGVCVTFISLVCGILFIRLDKAMEKQDAKYEYDKTKNENLIIGPVDGDQRKSN